MVISIPNTPLSRGGECGAHHRGWAGAESVIRLTFVSSLFWLLIGLCLQLLLAFKDQSPSFGGVAWLGTGRLLPAVRLVISYGWCGLGLIGALEWLCRVRADQGHDGSWLRAIGLCFWNIGVALGLYLILSGEMRSRFSVEFPDASLILIVVGFSLSIAGVFPHLLRAQAVDSALGMAASVSLLGVFLIPLGCVLVMCSPANGMYEQLICCWLGHQFQSCWLFVIGVSVCLCISGSPWRSQVGCASIGFWQVVSVVTFSSCAAFARLAGAPIPLWMVTVGGVCVTLLAIPLLMLTSQAFWPAAGVTADDSRAPWAMFARFGVFVGTISVVVNAVASSGEYRSFIHFTRFDVGLDFLSIFGLGGAACAAGIYRVLPTLQNCDWMSSGLIKVHFYGFSYGTVMMSVLQMISGILAGSDLKDPNVGFSQYLETSSLFYWGCSFATVLICVAFCAFGLNFALMLLRVGRPLSDASNCRGI